MKTFNRRGFIAIAVLSATIVLSEAFVMPQHSELYTLRRRTMPCVKTNSGKDWFSWQRSVTNHDSIRSHQKKLKRIFHRRRLWQRIRLQFKHFLATLALVIAVFVRVPLAHASGTIIAPNIETLERHIIEPQDLIASKRQGVVKPLLMAMGASVATFQWVRRRRSNHDGVGDDDNTIVTSNTSPSDSTKPLDDISTELESEVVGILTMNPLTLQSPLSPTSLVSPLDSSSAKELTPLLQQESMDVASPVAIKTSTSGAGVLEHDPAIEQEIHHNLDIAKEWTFLHQPAHNTPYPLRDPKFLDARRQPKSLEDKERLAIKYGSIDDISERAYQVLLDLGMIAESKPIDMSKFEGIIDTDKK